jgi:hypothetical protein
LTGKLEGKRPLGRPRCRWKDNIKWILGSWDRVLQNGFILSVEGSCEYDNEASSSIKYEKILEEMSDWRIFKDLAPWWS